MRKIFTLLVLLCSTLTVLAAEYPIAVAGKQVTDANKNDVLGDGKVVYNPSKKYLLLKDGTNISSKSDHGINFNPTSSQSLTVYIEGTVTIESAFAGIFANINATMTIDGSYEKENVGVLNTTSTNNGNNGITFYNNLTIKDCKVNAKGGLMGIGGLHSTNLGNLLTIDKSYVTAEGGEASIGYINSLSIKNCAISSPKEAAFNKTKKMLVEGTNPCKKVTIEDRSFGIFIAGVEVKDSNCKDVLGDGKVSFNTTDSILTLDNVNIDYQEEDQALLAAGFTTIDLKGDNVIKGTKLGVMVGFGNVTFTSTSGDGTLTCSCSEEGAIAFGAALLGIVTFKDCTVRISAEKGNGLSGALLAAVFVDNANLDVYGKLECISGFNNIEIKNAYIDKPNDAVIGGSGSSVGIYLDDSYVSDTHVIIKAGEKPEPDTIAPTIANTTVETVEKTDNSITIKWTAANDDMTSEEKLSYSISYKSKYSSWTIIDVVGETTCIIDNLEDDTDYTIKVSVMDEAGNMAQYDDLIECTVPTAINGIFADSNKAKAYSISGTVAGGSSRGIIIKNGKKYLVK